MGVINNVTHLLKDPSALTEYEKKIFELKNKGLSYKQIAEELGGTSTRNTIASRYQIIREKLAALEDYDGQ